VAVFRYASKRWGNATRLAPLPQAALHLNLRISRKEETENYRYTNNDISGMKRIPWIMAVVIAGAALSWLAYRNLSDRRAETRQKQATIERQNEVQNRIAEFARKYNAVTNWQQRLDGMQAFTVDVEEALINPTNRPVLFLGSVNDLVKRDGNNYVRFQRWVGGTEIHWLLEFNDDQWTTIRREVKEPQLMSQVYAVVARISSVKKASAKTAAVSTEGGDAEAGADSPEPFVAVGQCVDALALGDDALFIPSSP
jgi:hypothetical protein